MFSKPSRNHITIILEQIGAAGFILITGVFSLVFDFVVGSGRGFSSFLSRVLTNENRLPVTCVAVLLATAVVVWLFFRWSKTYFYIQDEYLVVEKNTLMHRVSRVPLDSISTVNVERNVFERVVGTAKVKLDINSAATANKTDFTFVLSHEKAQAFEKELVNTKAQSRQVSAEQERRLVCSFTAGQAVRDVLLGQPPAQLVLFLFSILSALFSVGNGNDTSRILTASFIFLSWFAGIVMQFSSAYGFRMERDENSFFISSGLLKKKQYSFDKNKVNALIISRPVFARICGFYRAEVAVIGLGNDKNETPRICLLVRKAELDRILAECAPDFICKAEAERSVKAGLVASLCFYLSPGAVAAVVSAFVSPWLSVAVVVFAVALGIAGYKSKTLAADDSVFSYSRGIFSKTTCCFKFGSIQTAQLCNNVLLNRFGVGKIRISILAARSVTMHTTGWFSIKKFDSLLNKLSY